MPEGSRGQALFVIRMHRGLTQEQVLGDLNKHLASDMSPTFFDGMEDGLEEIDAVTLNAWCEILSCSEADVANLAQNLQEGARMPEKERLREIISETEYQLWKDE